MTRRAPRGQNLVLLALTMLFLALMVTMTIGLGLRIRQKHELQNLADAAAFSNAVMTARAFNNMAAVNRLEVSHWVALAADESLISWTGYARGLGNGAHNGVTELLNTQCGDELPKATKDQLKSFRSELNAFVKARVDVPAWEDLDQAAGQEALSIQGSVAGLRDQLSDGVVSFNPDDLRERLFDKIKTQQLTQKLLDVADQPDIKLIPVGDEVERADSAPGVSMREVDCDFTGAPNGPLEGSDPPHAGLCLRGSWNENMLQAAMGTRGDTFLTGRPQLPPLVAGYLAQLDADFDRLSVIVGGKAGAAYWGNRLSHGSAPNGTELWADDHGYVTIRAGDCSYTQTIEGHVRSTHRDDPGDQHAYNPATLSAGDDYMLKPPDEVRPDQHHTMGDCQPLCPSVWVRSIGFLPSARGEADAYGQPKVLVALQRLPRVKRFPWELRFEFPFSATGQARGWDGTGQKLHTPGSDEADVSRQVAVATGIVYYHRREHWEEHPNLLNPFWRATLVPIDVDDRPEDLHPALSPPGIPPDRFQLQREAYRALRNAGYEGLH